MNKETRTFIWGLITFFCCALGVVSIIIRLSNDTFIFNTLNVTSGIFCLLGAISGAIRIYSTID